MRVFPDTNVLISALLNPLGTAAEAYNKAVSVDRDLLESGISHPKIMAPDEFVRK